MRRLLAIVTAASALLAAGPVAAQGPIRLPQLAPGEVLLEVDGIGIVRTPASAATVTTVAYGRGRTAEEAQRSLARDVERIRAAARAAGALPADISVEAVTLTDELRMYQIAARLEASARAVADDAEATEDAASRVTIRLRNAERAVALHNELNSDSTYGRLTAPVYAIDDPAAARRQARSAALAEARADADAYAEALGMRVLRTVRVTERAGFDYLGALLTEPDAMDHVSRLGPAYFLFGGTQRPEVSTAAVVGIDYVLGPR